MITARPHETRREKDQRAGRRKREGDRKGEIHDGLSGERRAQREVGHEREREPIPSGDRRFKYMVDRDLGCCQVTQFLGYIPPSKAPFHSHTYEEAIYILEGAGVVHTEQESTDFGPGTCIYLPPGTRHCLENPGQAAVRLLGVFYPSGSPAARYDED